MEDLTSTFLSFRSEVYPDDLQTELASEDEPAKLPPIRALLQPQLERNLSPEQEIHSSKIFPNGESISEPTNHPQLPSWLIYEITRKLVNGSLSRREIEELQYAISCCSANHSW